MPIDEMYEVELSKDHTYVVSFANADGVEGNVSNVSGLTDCAKQDLELSRDFTQRNLMVDPTETGVQTIQSTVMRTYITCGLGRHDKVK